MLKNHLDMIGRNEPVTKKAKFWQSYVRALKGTDDMRAPERAAHRPINTFRPFTDYAELNSWPHSKSIYDDPIHAVDRISTPGYRYQPVSRETYGYSPRNIYPHHYTPSDRYRPAPLYDARHKVWDDDLRLAARNDRVYPSRYPLMLTYDKKDDLPTAQSIADLAKPIFARPQSVPRESLLPEIRRPRSVPRSFLDDYVRPRSVPREQSVGFNYAGQPIYTRGGLTRRPLEELYNPLPNMPLSAITRDPWWYEYPELRPFESGYNYPWITPTPFYLRDSFLSPVKRTFLWQKHPNRPFAHTHTFGFGY